MIFANISRLLIVRTKYHNLQPPETPLLTSFFFSCLFLSHPLRERKSLTHVTKRKHKDLRGSTDKCRACASLSDVLPSSVAYFLWCPHQPLRLHSRLLSFSLSQSLSSRPALTSHAYCRTRLQHLMPAVYSKLMLVRTSIFLCVLEELIMAVLFFSQHKIYPLIWNYSYYCYSDLVS